jgi:hypothetical protein
MAHSFKVIIIYLVNKFGVKSEIQSCKKLN